MFMTWFCLASLVQFMNCRDQADCSIHGEKGERARKGGKQIKWGRGAQQAEMHQTPQMNNIRSSGSPVMGWHS